MKNVFIHVGNGCILKNKDIIGVFDLDNATVMKTSREFINSEEKKGRIESVFEDIPRSFVVCSDKTYLSSLNTASIIRRSIKKKIF